jgi:transcriptional regulator with XRE-family HTH domain
MRRSWDLLIEARRSSGLTQAQLARRLGTSQSAVAQLERRGTNPTVATLARALRAAGHRLVLSADAEPSSIDETLLARNLRMTPAQRLIAFETAHSEVEELRGLAERSRAR